MLFLWSLWEEAAVVLAVTLQKPLELYHLYILVGFSPLSAPVSKPGTGSAQVLSAWLGCSAPCLPPQQNHWTRGSDQGVILLLKWTTAPKQVSWLH